jgi:hypothetical protein
MMLALLLLVACSPFGGRESTEPDVVVDAATATPVPPTPITEQATPTSTAEPETPTPTVTPPSAPEEGATPVPTFTPTTAPDASSAGESGAAEEAASGSTEEQPAASGETTSSQPETSANSSPTLGNVVRNGSFEEGFDATGVAQGWTAFSSDNGAVFGWEPDSDPMHVSHGSHSQVLRIMGPGEPNTFIGVYQTIDVVPGETYTLALHGVIRSSLAAEDYKPLAFRVQYAIDETGGTDWEAVEWADWTDPGWNDVQLDVKWPPMDVYVIEITPTTDKITLFIRGWSKWAFFRSEAKFFVDGIFLQGPLPAEGMPPTGGKVVWVPLAGLLLVIGLAIWELRKRKAKDSKG